MAEQKESKVAAVESPDLVLSISIFIPGLKPTQEKIVVKNIRGKALGWQLTTDHIIKHLKSGLDKAF